MDMPRPQAEHERLARLAGSWIGDDEMHPSPWVAEHRTAIGRFETRHALGGFFAITDYEQELDGQIVYRGHGLFGFDPALGKYTMMWFDAMGPAIPPPALGAWDGEQLVFERQHPMGHSRWIYAFDGDDGFRVSLLHSRDGVDWQSFMDGTYRRAKSGAPRKAARKR